MNLRLADGWPHFWVSKKKSGRDQNVSDCWVAFEALSMESIWLKDITKGTYIVKSKEQDMRFYFISWEKLIQYAIYAVVSHTMGFLLLGAKLGSWFSFLIAFEV